MRVSEFIYTTALITALSLLLDSDTLLYVRVLYISRIRLSGLFWFRINFWNNESV